MNINILTATFCIVLFSLTVPFTRMAATQTPPESIILIRLLGASLVCLLFSLKGFQFPPRRAWSGIFGVVCGTVVGFSSFTAFAMKQVPAGHAAVALATMPIATAAYSVIRDKMNPGFKFWLFALAGTLFSLSFFFFMNVSEILAGDVLLLFAVLCAALGYVEGGRLSREFSGKKVMEWSILTTLPITVPLSIWYFSKSNINVMDWSASVWLSVGYLGLVSQSCGMFLWFKVLAIGPMEKIALVQLLQPFFTLLASIVFLNETVIWSTWIIALLVAVCVFGANKEKVIVRN